jgi:ABC-type methionine transport system ATPase subunit
MVFQEYNLVERLSVIENLLCGRLGYVPLWRVWTRRYPEADIARAFELLDRVGLGEFATRRADALSGGQRQRVGIARAVMQSPRLLLADEPTSSLDPRTSVEIMTLMRDIAAERDIPVIINIHDVALAKRFATRIVGMSEGRVVYDGPPEDLADSHLNRSTAAATPASGSDERDTAPQGAAGLRARAFRPDWRMRAVWLAFAVYVVYAAGQLNFTWDRFVVGLDRGAPSWAGCSRPSSRAGSFWPRGCWKACRSR